MSSLDNLRKAAKRWLKALAANDAEAHARFRRAYPDGPANPGLRDVQHALAREKGAESWIALKKQVQNESSPLPPLLEAAGKGDLARVVEILDRDPALLNKSEWKGFGRRTALHFAVAHEPVVRLLLERGADPNIRDEGDNAMPLHFAAENQDFPVIRLLVEHGADPVGAGDGHELEVIGWSCCWDYKEPNKEIVDYLLAHGAYHHIFSAVAMGEVETIRAIVARTPSDLARRMDRTNKRRTPLHLAVVKKQPAAVTALMDLGANLEALDAAGLTPLDQAALDGQTELAQLLIDRGARIRIPAAVALARTSDIERLVREDPDCLKPGQHFGTLIVRAAAASPGSVVERLIQLGASVNATDDESTSVDSTRGYTPLHAAAWTGNDDAVRVLMKHGADVNARESKYDSTPAGWANYAGHPHTRDLILRGPIDIIQAIQFDVTERIPQLLKTDPEAINRPYRGKTPLEWATLAKNVEAAKYISEELGKRVEPLVHITGSHDERVARFLTFACWDHRVHGKGNHRMHDRAAQRLLAQHPEIARDSIYTATVAGDLAEVERMLAERPELARERGSARQWTPLLYLCFMRFSHQPAIDNAVAIARTLLDHGASANEYYMAGHARYSAAAGVAREGEQDAPPHPRREELFQLLLERGANMYDTQVLYNTHFSGDVLWWLKRAYAHATKMGHRADWDDPNWSMFDMGTYGSGAQYFQTIADRKNDTGLARWIGEHGARPAPRTLTPHEAFIERCVQLDIRRAHDELKQHQEYLRAPATIAAFAVRDRADLVGVVLDLGVAVDTPDERGARPLHHAAAHNALRVAGLLIERGAEIDPRDRQWNSTPIGWAAYADHKQMVDFLSAYTKNVWTLAFRGYVDRLREVLNDEPELAKSIARDGTTPLWWLPDDESTAMQIADVLLAHGADPAIRNSTGKTAADWALERGMLQLAKRLGGTDPASSADA